MAAPLLYDATGTPVAGIDPAVAVQILPYGVDRGRWLATRRTGIGGSDVSPLVGLSKWTSRYELWEDKTGRLPLTDESPSEAATWGTLLEPVVRDEFARRATLAVRTVGMLRSVQWPWMLANPDGLVSDGGGYEGKALDVDTPMLTENGWSTMGELQVGDEVFHPDGHPTRVVGAFNVMNDHDCYLVTTTDGRSVVADAEHLWTVQDMRNLRRKSLIRETLTTAQLLERGYRMAGGRESAYRLPQQQAIISKPVDLPVDPYLLGAWLGDGTAGRAALTVGDQDLDETVRHLNEVGVRTTIRRGRTAWSVYLTVDRPGAFRARMRELGTWSQKRIPDVYLTAGTEQRLSLLQGLLDTDGSISTRGQIEFSSCERQLADSVLYLVRSLGWRANEMHVNDTSLGGRRMKPRWRVRFTPEQGDPIPFRLSRKIARIHAVSARGQNRRHPTIKSIVPVDSRPVRCIKVDREDGLFLAGRDLIPTHNTCSPWQAHEWGTNEHPLVPDHAELQSQWCMAVTGLPHWWVAGLIGGQTLAVRLVERDDELIAELVRISSEFWQRNVLADVEPDLDGSDACTRLLTERFPVSTEDEIADVDEETRDELVIAREKAVAGEKAAKADSDAVKNRVRHLMGNAERLLCGDEEIATWKTTAKFKQAEFRKAEPTLVAEFTRQVMADVLDVDALKAAHPDTYRRYCSRELRFKD